MERADRNMIEMLQELRVAQTGIQILFAFLLSLSFTERFGRIDEVQRWTYVVTLLMTTLTTGLLVAPAAVHRILFGRRVKRAVVRIGQRLFVAGLVTLALTLMGAVLLVLDIAIGRGRAIPITVGVGVMLVGAVVLLPLPVLRRGERDEPGEPDRRPTTTAHDEREAAPGEGAASSLVDRRSERAATRLRRGVDVPAPAALLDAARLDERLEVLQVALDPALHDAQRVADLLDEALRVVVELQRHPGGGVADPVEGHDAGLVRPVLGRPGDPLVGVLLGDLRVELALDAGDLRDPVRLRGVSWSIRWTPSMNWGNDSNCVHWL